MFGILFVVLTFSGPVDAVISRSIDTTPERAEDLLNRVTAACAEAGIPIRAALETRRLLPAGTVSSKCAARRACVRELGAALGSQAVIGVDVGHVTGQMAVNLEAVSTSDGSRLAQHSFAIDSAGYPAGLEAELKKFTRALAKLMQPVDAPVAVKLAPEPERIADAPVVVAEPSRPAGPLVLGGVAVVAVIAAVALAVAGASTAGTLEQAYTIHQGQPASTLSRAQADSIAASANGQYTGAAISAGAAVALGTGALLWWTFD